MATFYDQIGANKRNSLLLALLVMVLLGVLGLAIGWAVTGDPSFALPSMGIAVGVALLASLFSYYAGDSLVLGISGAKELKAEDAPQLWNVVQEMAIASNVPMPRVYLIDDTAPNAFATGRDPKHASVAITTGLLQKLDREELQGVMAHELSHVRNFDIRFSLMVGVLVGSIALLADFFLRFTFWGGGRRSRSNSEGGGGLQIVVFLVAIVLAILAPIVARLVQMAVSRQREYLADASGVELTRNPVGLERALAKITLDTEPLEVANRATQHLYFDNPLKAATGKSSNLFSTHPPALERINRLRQLSGQPPVTAPDQVLDAGAMAAALGQGSGGAATSVPGGAAGFVGGGGTSVPPVAVTAPPVTAAAAPAVQPGSPAAALPVADPADAHAGAEAVSSSAHDMQPPAPGVQPPAPPQARPPLPPPPPGWNRPS